MFSVYRDKKKKPKISLLVSVLRFWKNLYYKLITVLPKEQKPKSLLKIHRLGVGCQFQKIGPIGLVSSLVLVELIELLGYAENTSTIPVLYPYICWLILVNLLFK